jgi:hypothetical protein
LFVALAGFALSGCALLDGGQTGQSDGPRCQTPTVLVPPNRKTALGISAEELLQSLPPLGGTAHLYRPDQNETLTLTLSSPSAARVVAPGKGSCRAILEIDVVASLLTDEGLFDTSVPVTLEAESQSSWQLQGERKLSEISGTYDWSVFQPTQWKDPSLQIQMRTGSYATLSGAAGGPGAITGNLWLVGGDPDPSDNSVPVATAVGDWFAGAFFTGGTGGGAGSGGSAGDVGGGGVGGGNGSPGGAGGTVGGVNSTGGVGGG